MRIKTWKNFRVDRKIVEDEQNEQGITNNKQKK